MKFADIKKVCVVGGGLMGRQIALNTAIHGLDTWLTDAMPAVLDKVREWAKEYMDGRVEKGRMTKEQADAALAKFHVVGTLEEAAKDSGNHPFFSSSLK